MLVTDTSHLLYIKGIAQAPRKHAGIKGLFDTIYLHSFKVICRGNMECNYDLIYDPIIIDDEIKLVLPVFV